MQSGTSDARAAKWLGFAADCDCHVGDNDGEIVKICETHIVNHDGSRPESCSHVISPACHLHRGWTPGDTAVIARRPHAFSGDPAAADSEVAT